MNDQTEIQQLLEQAKSLSNSGKYKEAIEVVNQVIAIDSQNADAYELLGYLHDKNNRNDLSIKAYSKAIKLSPENVDLYVARGYIFLEEENYKEILVDIKKAFSLSLISAGAINLMRFAFEKNPKWLDINIAEKMIEEYVQYIDTNNLSKRILDDDDLSLMSFLNDLSSLYERLGIIYADQKKYKQAIGKYMKAIEYNGGLEAPLYNFPSVHYLLGQAYSELGQYQAAIVEFDKSTNISRKSSTYSSRESYPGADEGRSNALLKLIEKQESDFQGKIEEFLSGPNSIFELHDRFLEREKECSAHYHKTTKWIAVSLYLTFLAIVLGITAVGLWLNFSEFFSTERNAFSILPYIGIVLLFAAVPVWWTRILLRSRDRWQILQEDCFRKSSIMQYVKATGGDAEFRNQIILETIKHMANRGGSDLLLALHSDDPGMLYSVTDIIEKVLKNKSKK